MMIKIYWQFCRAHLPIGKVDKKKFKFLAFTARIPNTVGNSVYRQIRQGKFDPHNKSEK